METFDGCSRAACFTNIGFAGKRKEWRGKATIARHVLRAEGSNGTVWCRVAIPMLAPEASPQA